MTGNGRNWIGRKPDVVHEDRLEEEREIRSMTPPPINVELLLGLWTTIGFTVGIVVGGAAVYVFIRTITHG